MASHLEPSYSDPSKLFASYIDLSNQVITENLDKPWFRKAMQLNKPLWNGRTFRAVVYDQDPGAVVADFVVQLDMDKPEIRQVQDADEDNVAFTWKTPLS